MIMTFVVVVGPYDYDLVTQNHMPGVAPLVQSALTKYQEDLTTLPRERAAESSII